MPAGERIGAAHPRQVERVEALFQAWVEAAVRSDAGGVARLHARDGVLQLPGSPSARGRDAIRRRCADWLGANAGGASFALEDTRVFDAGDIATCSGRFRLDRPGGSNGDHDRGRLLLVAQRDGRRWRLRFSGLFSDAFLSELSRPAV